MKSMRFTVVIIICLFVLYSLVNWIGRRGEQAEFKSNLTAVVLNCLPRDHTEQTIFTIEQRNDGEYLSCERHKRVSYAQAAKGKPYRLHLAMGDQ